MKVIIEFYDYAPEVLENVEMIGVENMFYWFRQRKNGKRTVNRYALLSVRVIKEYYED